MAWQDVAVPLARYYYFLSCFGHLHVRYELVMYYTASRICSIANVGSKLAFHLNCKKKLAFHLIQRNQSNEYWQTHNWFYFVFPDEIRPLDLGLDNEAQIARTWNSSTRQQNGRRGRGGPNQYAPTIKYLHIHECESFSVRYLARHLSIVLINKLCIFKWIH